LTQLREFFAGLEVLEVETPLLASATVTDPSLDPLAVGERWLQTSPEYAMKRLLAAGSGPIYQVCKAFRAGEAGRRHNPEFTMLEWYRPGFDQHQLMSEVAALVRLTLGRDQHRAFSYRELFLNFLDIDPFTASVQALVECGRRSVDTAIDSTDRDLWLDLLLSHCIEPQLAGLGLVFVYDYPASQAALARLRPEGDLLLAERFELYVDGMELANGYCELTDPLEQAQRFQCDQQRLADSGKDPRAADPRLLAAMEQGLPACAGVALGLDRLLMLQTGAGHIGEVLSFDWSRS